MRNENLKLRKKDVSKMSEKEFIEYVFKPFKEVKKDEKNDS